MRWRIFSASSKPSTADAVEEEPAEPMPTLASQPERVRLEPRRRSARGSMRTIGLVVAVALALGWAQPLWAASGESGIGKAREAAVALARGDAAAAAALYDAALADPTLPADRRVAIHTDRGVARARLGQVQEAIEDFNRAIRLSPEGAAAYNNRGNLLLALGLDAEALKDFDRAILLAPGYAAAYNNRALARQRRGETVAALRDFTRAVKLAPTSPAPLDGRARSALRLGRAHTAMADVTRAIELDARFGPAYRTRAEAHFALARPEKAIEDLSRASAFEPANAEIVLLRGRAYLATGDHEAAARDLERAAELSTPTAARLTLRARAAMGLGEHEVALAHLTRAIEIDPRHAPAYAYRARVYALLQQFEAGAKDAERALGLDAGLAVAHWAAGEIHLASERAEAAAAALRTALSLDPALREAREALARLGLDAATVGEVEHPDRGHGPWGLFATGKRYSARHVEQARFEVPLEAIEGQVPRLVAWELASGPYAGVGILRYSPGVLPAPEGGEEIEMAALVDTSTFALLAMLPVRTGSDVARWQWEADRLSVTTHDGLVREVALGNRESEKAPALAAVPGATRRLAETPHAKKGPGSPAWAPWNENHSYKGGRRENSGERRRSTGSGRKPKTFFDMLFGN
jgi:tetratricopeptide (TPR) repeat protein